MTMQTTNPLLQVSGASATAQRTVNPDRQADNGAFGATLSRELAARQPEKAPPAQQSKPAAQPAKPTAQQQSKPNAADKPARHEPAPENGTRATLKPAPNEAQTKTAATKAEGTEESAEAAAAAEAAEAAAAAATPVTDMLAFMASLSKPASSATDAASLSRPSAGADAAAVPLETAAAGADELQLTALQNALGNMTRSTAATGDSDAGAAAAADALGKQVSLASGVQRAPVEAAASQGQAQAANALPEGQQDAAQFQAQLRDSQQQLPTAHEEAPAPLAQLQAQAAKLDATAAPTAVPGDRIPARVGTQAWDNQVSQRIVYMVGKEQAATLTLNPPDLGPVQIVLNVSNDQATVAFSSEQLEVRQALENALPRLREMMSESGIALNNATVDSGAASQRQQQDSERRAQGGNGAGGNLANGGGDAEPAVNEVAPRTRTVSIGDRGMVDLFA